jgi:hypothetical protein
VIFEKALENERSEAEAAELLRSRDLRTVDRVSELRIVHEEPVPA